LETALRLIHPYMPFVTEELWQRIPRRPNETTASIMIAPYPQPQDGWKNDVVDEEINTMMAVVTAARSLRSQYKIVNKVKPEAALRCRTTERKQLLSELLPVIATLAWLGPTDFLTADSEIPSACCMKIVDDDTGVFLKLKGVVDAEKEIARLEKLIVAKEQSLAGINKKIGNAKYQEATSEQTKKEDADKVEAHEQEIRDAREAIVSFQKLLA